METAAHGVLLSLCVFFYNSLPFAISIAGTIRVGNLLGAGRPKQVRPAPRASACAVHMRCCCALRTRGAADHHAPGTLLPSLPCTQARLAGYVCLVVGVLLQSGAGIALGASQGQMVRIFTSDPAVLEAVKSVVYLAMGFQVSRGARSLRLRTRPASGEARRRHDHSRAEPRGRPCCVAALVPACVRSSPTACSARRRACCAPWAARAPAWCTTWWAFGRLASLSATRSPSR